MRVSDAVKVDHEYRHYRKAQTLLATITDRLEWYQANLPREVTDLHLARAAGISSALEREISGPKLVWEINTSITRRPILTLPIEQILDYIFYKLPKPRPAKYSDQEESIIELMTMRARQLAANQHKFLCMCEIAYRAKQNWYMIFNTLTVRPGEFYNVFSKNNGVFKQYVRKMDRLAAASAFGTIRAAIGRDYHSHFAVTEEGGQNGRLHIHSLHFQKEPPIGSYDPNSGKQRPTERELHCLKNIWPYGRQAPIIVRYSPIDAWGRAGYRWPIDVGTNEPLLIQSPQALANYMAKYIKKGYNSCQRANLLWRVKKSHKLGLQILKMMTDEMTTPTLLILTTADNMRAKLNNQMIPQNLLRLSSLRSLRDRLSTTKSNNSTLTDIAKLATPRLSPLHYSRASIQTIQTNNQQSMQFLSTLGLFTEDTFKTAWKELQNAAERYNKTYFPPNTGVQGTTSTRDHLYHTQNTNDA